MQEPKPAPNNHKPGQELPSVRTACPYCGVGCGVIATADEQGNVSVNGDKDHPANFGKLCSKGLALGETFTPENRLLSPRINGKEASWDEATDYIADAFLQIIQTHGPESIGFYGSGQLLTEDYYVVNKFVKGWLGTANIDTNSRLCMASSVMGHKRAFGTDTVPGAYEDLECAELIVLVGSNLAWCHPVIYQRIMERKAQHPQLKLIVIDPRRSITAENADLHLAIKPDGDSVLFNALLHYLITHDVADMDYVDSYIDGFDEARATARQAFTDDLDEKLGVPYEDLEQFFQMVASTEKTVTVYSQGVNQSSSGTDKVSAILNCHLATGRIGKPGTGPFSITGQPNAMGGREVGGLATMLAAHRELNDPEHREQVQRFWHSPKIADKPGLTAVDMFKAVQSGELKAIWIMATNPVDSLPEADSVIAALQACPLVVVSEVCDKTDTLSYANVVLPAQAFGEKDGTVTNSERRISRQKRFKAPMGQAKPDWWAIARVASKMGYEEAFSYENPAQIFREHAQLSAFENNGSIDFDIGGCAELSDSVYDTLLPFQWPYTKTGSASQADKQPLQANTQTIRFFAKGGYYTPNNRARMIAVESASPGNDKLSDNYPLILNTGRIRDQWHTMTRTGYISRLMGHRAEPFVEINPADALIHGIGDADVVQISTEHGDARARAMLSDRQSPGQLFMAMHWSNQFASSGRVNALFDALTCPHSRQPASKNQAARISRLPAKSYAFILTREQPMLSALTTDYWASAPLEQGWRSEIASCIPVDQLLEQLMHTASSEGLQRVEYQGNNSHRLAWFTPDNRLQAMLYVSDTSVELSRSWAMSLLTQTFDTPAKRWQLMAGRAPANQPDKGAIVCSCFNVGDKEIARAIKLRGCCSVEAVGRQLSAGTNCGSCRNEIGVLVKQHTNPSMNVS